MICAVRFGLTGTGGSGAGVSRERKAVWSSLRDSSSSRRRFELELVEMALLLGSRWIGRSVKDSVSSIVLRGIVLTVVFHQLDYVLRVGERKTTGYFGVTLLASCEVSSYVVGGLITSRTDNSYSSKHCLHSVQTLYCHVIYIFAPLWVYSMK